MNYKELEKQLSKINKSTPWITTPKEILQMMGGSKRSWRIVDELNGLLHKYNLQMSPDFANAHFNTSTVIKSTINNTQLSEEIIQDPKEKKHDPIPRLSRIRSANLRKLGCDGTCLLHINRDTSLQEAITLMLHYNYSQLPILSNKQRRVEGIVSWKSIGKSLGLNRNPIRAYDCREEVDVVHINTPLLQVVGKIIKREVVLVRDSEDIICGIITTNDITDQFKLHAEPFFLIEQIEKQIRIMLEGYDIEQMKTLIDLEKCEKEIHDIYDMTFGQYLLILQNESFFNMLNLPVDRKTFIDILDNIRVIRNEVMHFAPDGTTEEDLLHLRNTANFLSEITHR